MRDITVTIILCGRDKATDHFAVAVRVLLTVCGNLGFTLNINYTQVTLEI